MKKATKIYIGMETVNRAEAENSDLWQASDAEAEYYGEILGDQDSMMVSERISGIVVHRKVCRR